MTKMKQIRVFKLTSKNKLVEFDVPALDAHVRRLGEVVIAFFPTRRGDAVAQLLTLDAHLRADRKKAAGELLSRLRT